MSTLVCSGRAAAFAAFALSVAESVTPSFATTTTQHYQQQASLVCAGLQCTAKFPKLAANQALDIGHLACEVNAPGGDVFGGYMTYISPIPASSVSMPLGLLWQRTTLNSTKTYTFGGELDLRVPHGDRPSAVFTGNITLFGNCVITGTLLVSN